jgi:predicted transcriptional regulator
MVPDTHLTDLLRFFKVLAEPQRLRIIGLLAQRPHTVEAIARALHLSDSTVSHHLSRLSDAGLVAARAESYYNVYSLQTDVLTMMARTILKETEEPRTAETGAADAFEKKVIETFTTPEGRIRAFPTTEKKYLVLVRYVLRSFEPGVRYTEKRVNQILAGFNEDTARLRRSLVDHGYMAREGGGGKYWRTDV